MAVAYAEPAVALSSPGVDPPTAALVRAVDDVLAVDVATLSDALVLARQRVLLAQIERLRAAALGGLRSIDTRNLYAEDGAGSAAGWLRAQAVADERLSVQTARRLDSMPVAASEAAAGRLAVQDVQTIAGALARLPAVIDPARLRAVVCDGATHILAEVYGGDAVAVAAARARLGRIAESGLASHRQLEETFVLITQAMAERLPGCSLRVVLADLVDALLPAEHDERAARKHSVRHLVLRPVFDGGWHLRGFLDDDTGALLRWSLDHYAPGEPEKQRPGTERSSDQQPAAGKMSKERQEHDALHAALVHLLGAPPAVRTAACGEDTGDPGAAGEPATSFAPRVISEPLAASTPPIAGAPPAAFALPVALTLTASADALLGAPGALPARLGNLMRIAPATLERLACGALTTGVLLDSDGRPVHVGRSRRHASRAQRLALQEQWGELCAAAGCGRVAMIPHHVVWWRHGGSTDLHNLVPLCHHSHHDVHTGRKTLRLRDGRWIGPDGWTDGPSP